MDSCEDSAASRSARVRQGALDQNIRRAARGSAGCLADGSARFLSYLRGREDSNGFSHFWLSRVRRRPARWYLHQRYGAECLERDCLRYRSYLRQRSSPVVFSTPPSAGRTYVAGARQPLFLSVGSPVNSFSEVRRSSIHAIRRRPRIFRR